MLLKYIPEIAKGVLGGKQRIELKSLGGEKFGKRCMPSLPVLGFTVCSSTVTVQNTLQEACLQAGFSLARPQNVIYGLLSVWFDMFAL